jgi:WD40 repeat protein
MARLQLGLALVVLIVAAPWMWGQQQLVPEKLTAPALDSQHDGLPAAARARLGTLGFRHRDQVLAGLTSDGNGLLLFGREGLKVMDLESGQVTPWTQSNHRRPDQQAYVGRSSGPLTQLVFPNDGSGLVLSFIRLSRRSFPHLPLTTPGGKTLLLPESFEDFDCTVFDKATGKRLHRLRSDDFAEGNSGLAFLAVNGDGTRLISQTTQQQKNEVKPGKLLCFELASKQLHYTIDPPPRGSLQVPTVGSDGRTLFAVAVNGAGKGELQSWDIATGKPLSKFPLEVNQAARFQSTADGKHLFVMESESSTIRHLDARTGAELHAFTFGKDTVQSYLASGDGKFLYVVTATGIEQWNMAAASKVRTLVPGYGADRLVLSPAGDKLHFVGDTTVTTWDTATGQELRPGSGHAATVWALAFSPDGRQLLTSSHDGTARLWDTQTRQHLRAFVLPGRFNQGHFGAEAFAQLPFTQAGFSSDGKRIITAWPNGPVQVWDVATGNSQKLGQDPLQGSVAVACSPRDNLVATVSPDGRIQLWDVAHGEQRLDFQWQPVQDSRRRFDLATAAFSPSGLTLAVAGASVPQNRLRLFETSTARERLDFDLAGNPQRDLGEVPALVLAQRLVLKLAYSGDGKVLALAGVHAIYLHDAATGKERLVLSGPNTFGPSVSLSPDGSLAAAGTLDGCVRLWDVKTGRVVSEVKGHDYFVSATAFSPDGKTLASGSNDCTVLLWDVAQLLRQPLPSSAATASTLDRLWADLASSDAVKAFAAMAQLTEVPAETPAYFKTRLQAVPVPDPKRIDALVADLNSDQYALRQKAMVELEKLADLAVPALREQLAKKASLEMCKRIELLLAKINGPAADPEMLRALRAVEVLEAIGTPPARLVLETLAQGAPAHRVTQAAAEALKRQRSLPTPGK